MSGELRETKLDIAVQRWIHAITGHIAFSIFLGAWHTVSLLPIAVCSWFFMKTGGIIFLAAIVPFAAISGGVWASVHGINRQLQFEHTTYLFKELWKHLQRNFLQGACLGVLLLLACIVLYLPLAASRILQTEMPFALLCIIMTGTVLLPVAAEYTFYQISRWKISLFAAIRNSFVLMFRMGWRSAVVCVIWLAAFLLVAIFPYILVPLSLFCGLTSVLNMTTHALFAPEMDVLMVCDSNE